MILLYNIDCLVKILEGMKKVEIMFLNGFQGFGFMIFIGVKK